MKNFDCLLYTSFVTELDSGRKLLDEIAKFSPSEIICNESLYMSGLDLEDLKNRLGITIYSLDAWYFDDGMCTKVLKDHFKAVSYTHLDVYKRQDEPMTFAELLQEIEKIEGLERIRFMTSHPKDLSDELIEVMRHSKKTVSYTHLDVYKRQALKLEGIDTFLEAFDRYTICPEYADTFGAKVYKISRDAQGMRSVSYTHLR